MYFWRDKKLANDLHKGIVTEKQQMLYLLFGSIFMALFLTATANANVYAGALPLSLYSYLIDIIFICGTILSVMVSFKVNNAGDAKDFIIRYTCINLPIIIKFTFFIFVLSVPAAIIDMVFFKPLAPEILEQISQGQEIADETIDLAIEKNIKLGPTTALLMFVMYIYIIRRLVASFRIASGQKEYK